PAQLDDRIQQWMAMATPQHASDQVAALTGVTPAADPGQPERLALNRAAPEAPALAQVEIPQSQPRPQVPTQPVAEIPATPPVAMPEPMPVSAPAVAVAAPVVETPDPVVADAAQSLLEAPVVADAAQSLLEAPVEAAIEAPGAIEAPVVKAVASAPELPTKFEAEPTPAYVAITETVRSAADHPDRAKGRSSSVVQLGAYSSPDRVAVAWDLLTKRYPALAEYTPMRARFDGPKGTVWRLSIRGFGDQREAIARCEALQSRGGKCFVRLVAGDSPVQFASR
ncbi:MAG TPA: SPOR domain-containing protein, partial [Sphingomicrobium sp.]|nr:SPOR domain-containing protein [Sphingomicrobium sp.]